MFSPGVHYESVPILPVAPGFMLVAAGVDHYFVSGGIAGCTTGSPASRCRTTDGRRDTRLVARRSGAIVAGRSAHPERTRGGDQRQRTAGHRCGAIARPKTLRRPERI